MPTVRFASGSEGSQSFVSEGAGFFNITLVLSQASAVPVTVTVRPFASSVDAADMDLGDVTITFAPGQTSATYRAQIFNDAIDEIDENVTFEIVAASEATIDLSSHDAYRILGRILDDDVPAGPTVRFMPGAQGSQSFVSEGAGFFNITLVLSQASATAVSVVVRPFASAVDASDMDLRDVTLTFAPGETTAVYRAQIHDDAIDEIDENVHFEIVSATGATVDLSAYEAFRILGRLLDNDAPSGPTVRFAPGAQGTHSFVAEGSGWFSIPLILSQASSVPVTVVIRPFASGVDAADMDLSDVSVTFAPGETSAFYRARIFADAIDEVDESLFFEIVSVTNATTDLSASDAYRILGRIRDDDGPPMTGTAGADQLTGTQDNDVIDGLGGDDILDGAGGDDVILGREGNDDLSGGPGADAIAGGAGDDRIEGGSGADELIGGLGRDTFRGSAADWHGDVVVDLAVGDRLIVTDRDPATFAFSFANGLLSFGGSSVVLRGVHPGANLLARPAAEGGVELVIQPQFAGAGLVLRTFGSDPAAGGWSSADRFPRALADVNGDGRVDVVGFGNDGVFLSLGTVSGGFAAPFLASSAFGAGAGAGGWMSDDRFPRHLADVNGDGRADLVGFGEAGVYVSLAGSNGAFAAPTLASTAFGSGAGAGGWSSNDLFPRRLADVNGDGRADIVGFGNGGVYVSLATANGLFAAPTLAIAAFGAEASAGGWSSQNRFVRQLADVNGDGRADVVGFGSGGVFIALASASGTFAAPTLALAEFGESGAAGGWSSFERFPRMLGDVDGDGRVDIVGFGDDGVFIARGRGDGTFEGSMRDLGFFGAGSGAGGWSSSDRFPRALADIDDDGALDIVGFASTGVYVALSSGDIWG